MATVTHLPADRPLDEHAFIFEGIAAQGPDAAETAMHLRMIDRHRDR